MQRDMIKKKWMRGIMFPIGVVEKGTMQQKRKQNLSLYQIQWL